MNNDDFQLNKQEMKLIMQLIPAFSQVFFEQHAGHSIGLEGLNKSHVHAVVFLNINGPNSMSTVARFLGLEKGSFTPVANRLLDWGFVTREVDPTDRRRQVLHLTDSGRSFAEHLRKNRGARFADQVGKLSKTERKQFFSSLERLEELLVKINGGSFVHPMQQFGTNHDMKRDDAAEDMTE